MNKDQVIRDLIGHVNWMSAAGDFQPGGKAHNGWEMVRSYLQAVEVAMPSAAPEEPSKPERTAADFLRSAASIYEERKPLYGDNYRHVGRAMVALFPNGIEIESDDEETWNRLHFVFHLYSKLSRYCMNLKRGGHPDSLDDLAVYAMLARECDE